ncbi:hypothetical protein MTP99_013509 [Tenebrio molitor]|nr:hypothetical protein MTP99_013509 [Tenebrio molitor]
MLHVGAGAGRAQSESGGGSGPIHARSCLTGTGCPIFDVHDDNFVHITSIDCAPFGSVEHVFSRWIADRRFFSRLFPTHMGDGHFD